MNIAGIYMAALAGVAAATAGFMVGRTVGDNPSGTELGSIPPTLEKAQLPTPVQTLAPAGPLPSLHVTSPQEETAVASTTETAAPRVEPVKVESEKKEPVTQVPPPTHPEVTQVENE